MASGLLPKSPVSSSLCDEVPHIFIPKSHLEPREFLISSAKRLLQQYRTKADNGGFWPGMVCPLMTQMDMRPTSLPLVWNPKHTPGRGVSCHNPVLVTWTLY